MTTPSIVCLPNQWFIVCRSRELRRRPVATRLHGEPLVLFRDHTGAPAALVDRCPHRNVPLSAGRMAAGQIECTYHGWRFDGSGACRAVPGLCGDADRRGRRATAHPATEQDGFVWVRSTPGTRAATRPPSFPHLGETGYATIQQSLTVPSGLFHALENALDVPHTAFLHRGLFRTGDRRREIDVVVRRFGDRAEAEYVGEARPAGLIGRLLAPGGGVVEHVDRFLLPSIAQVEYRLGRENHLLVTSAMTPLDDCTTRIWAVIALRLRIPSRLVAPLVTPLANRILRQDRIVLGLQARTIGRFGGEQFASTELDVLGAQITHLLAAAARGAEPGTALEHEHRVAMAM